MVSGSALAVGFVPREQPVGLAGAVPDREQAGQPERIEPVQVAPRRQHVGGAQQVAAGHWADVAGVQRVHAWPAVRDPQRAAPSSRVPLFAFGARRRHLAFRSRSPASLGGLADDVQARAGSARIPVRCSATPMRTISASAASPHSGAGLRPGSTVGRLRLHELRRAPCALLRHPRPGSSARQRSSEAFRSSRPRYSPACATGGVRYADQVSRPARRLASMPSDGLFDA